MSRQDVCEPGRPKPTGNPILTLSAGSPESPAPPGSATE